MRSRSIPTALALGGICLLVALHAPRATARAIGHALELVAEALGERLGCRTRHPDI